MQLNLIDAMEKGINAAKDRPATSLYGWTMAHRTNENRDWDNQAIHVSDYAVGLPLSERKCQKQLRLRVEDADCAETPVWQEVMFSQGNAMENRCAYWLTLGLPDEWEVNLSVNVSEGLPEGHGGEADIILVNEKLKQVIVVEVKTSRGAAFKFRDGPRMSHELQASTYRMAADEMYPEYNVNATILYLDREGQNPPEQYPADIENKDIMWCAKLAEAINKGEIEPEMMQTSVEVRRNKGTDSWYVKQPWQCVYCDYKGYSCPGALPEELEDNSIICKFDEIGDDIDWKCDPDKKEKYQEIIVNAVTGGNITER